MYQDWEYPGQNVPCIYIAHKDHKNTIQVYSVTVITHVITLEGGGDISAYYTGILIIASLTAVSYSQSYAIK